MNMRELVLISFFLVACSTDQRKLISTKEGDILSSKRNLVEKPIREFYIGSFGKIKKNKEWLLVLKLEKFQETERTWQDTYTKINVFKNPDGSYYKEHVGELVREKADISQVPLKINSEIAELIVNGNKAKGYRTNDGYLFLLDDLKIKPGKYPETVMATVQVDGDMINLSNELGSLFQQQTEVESAVPGHLIDTFSNFTGCRAEDISVFLPPYSKEKMNTKTLYLGWLDIIQKLPNGFLMTPHIPKGGGFENLVLFVKMDTNWTGRHYTGWFYLDGEYNYTALDGFERKAIVLKVYPGHLLTQRCRNNEPPLPCPKRNGSDCF